MTAAAEIVVAVGLAFVPSSTLAGASDPPGARSHEILRYECRNDLARRDITLFANGTVRLREGPWDDQFMALDELSPDALKEILSALGSVETGAASPPTNVDGRWSEECRVSLDLPNRPAWTVRFSGWAVPPVAVSRIVQVAEDLALETRVPASGRGLPEGTEPRTGDVLVDTDGGHWEVLRRTADGGGLELESLEQPIRIYVDVDGLGERFERLIPHGER